MTSVDQFSDHRNDTITDQPMMGKINNDDLTLRALVSTKEAGVIIGKGGSNVAKIRESTGVKAGVSKSVQGIPDRVLTISGTLQGVAKAYSLIANTLSQTLPANNMHMIHLRLLVSHNLMGSVIGRQGVKIKQIQDTWGVRMVASKTLLPQSTERIIEIKGTVDGIYSAILDMGRCLMEDKDRAYGTILYNPIKASQVAQNTAATVTAATTNTNTTPTTAPQNNNYSPSSSKHQQQQQQPAVRLDDPAIRTQNISIPADMVGCIIGKGGAKIAEIRRLSGSRISIAKMPHDETGERMFTIQGTPEANERALYLLYEQLENEKERRLRSVLSDNLIENEPVSSLRS
ncbi:Putative KH domain RNA-binding protein [Rhizopus microsporus]|nr:Putative KH domain RNA-binding protein [Rhizopus microsporus]